MEYNYSTFLKVFLEQFQESVEEEIKPATEFKKLREWDSMHSLMVLASLDAAFDFTLTDHDLKESETIEDLFIRLKKIIEA